MQQAPQLQPVTYVNLGHNQTLLPGEYIATQQFRAPPRQTQLMMQGTTMPWAYGDIGSDPGRDVGESSDGAACQE
jgi:hypothetical protein